jgi:hypothetical protein
VSGVTGMRRSAASGVRGPALLAWAAAGLLALTGCGSSGGGGQPSWAKALGAGVTVDAPTSAQPGHGSPGAAVQGFLTAIEAKNWAALCGYVEPAVYGQCTQLSTYGSAASRYFPSLKNIGLGYTATDGNRALVGTTGTLCAPPASSSTCHTNKDPAAILSSGKPFSTLWAEANNSSANAYSLALCVKAGESWYVYLQTM